MAKYVYRCDKCGKLLEREYPMGEAPGTKLSYCAEKGKTVEIVRVYLPTAFQIGVDE